ncbi:glycoside hydrolase family 65 protein [Anoxynatronum buryatiense]|uniref:Alpha,alpha-trehalose phosphorylase n=1 Tax=Anoxynatronum buryatiense TaxID=489973 RepID=A0AA46AHA9_9CLOT|nr:glycosyl hydrolase family 65 protein [Anoxynatronum buryatiense]SMP38436.1 alpha,alpha-trehalose phosphorylase [Anoxynatronum buryatiense]
MSRNRQQKKIFYKVDPWKIIETDFDPQTNFLSETVFSLGNGNLGIRGSFEEGYDGPAGTSMEGTYLNGFFEKVPIHYDETAYGYATHTETMLNVPNGKLIQLQIEDEVFSLFTGTIEKYRRELDLQQGILRRYTRWVSPRGKIVDIEVERMVSFAEDSLVLIRYAVTPVNFNGTVQVISMLDGHVHNQTAENDPRIGTSLTGQTLKLEKLEQKEDASKLLQVTTHSKLQVLSCIHNLIESGHCINRMNHAHGQMLVHRYTFAAKMGERISLTKSLLYLRSDRVPPDQLWEMADTILETVKQQGWAHYHMVQRQVMDDFWMHCDIDIAGNDELQQGLRFNLFHLFQSAGRDGSTNIAAKGLTGEGYQGHYFWDSEIYIVPFFIYTQPWIARKLLEYRFNTLDQARRRAHTLFRKKGALFPWRTITGIECSSYYPAGTAQYHINADIVHAIRQYEMATGDWEFILNFGAEIIFETARIWLYIGAFSGGSPQRFCIFTVTGPDEYTALVNNNFYTNAMAKSHLNYAAALAKRIAREDDEDFSRISRKIDLGAEEIEQWQMAADAMYLPKDEERGIHPQDDSFLDKPVWPFDTTPENHYPLLLHYHPLDIYRHQVCKQADVVLALYLLHDQFSHEEKKRDLAYYEQVTTHDSSLSRCIFSIIGAETGDTEKASSHFLETARLDLDNLQGNAHHGIHTASMAGTWLSLVNGFAGMRISEEGLRFSPQIPVGLTGYSFRIKFRGNCFKVNVSVQETTVKLLEGDGFEFYYGDEKFLLLPEESIQLQRKRE